LKKLKESPKKLEEKIFFVVENYVVPWLFPHKRSFLFLLEYKFLCSEKYIILKNVNIHYFVG